MSIALLFGTTLELSKQFFKEGFIRELDFSGSIIISKEDISITTRIVATTKEGQKKLQLYGKEIQPKKFIRFGGGQNPYFQFENDTAETIDIVFLEANGKIIQTEFSFCRGEEAKVLPSEKKVFEPPDLARVKFSY